MSDTALVNTERVLEKRFGVVTGIPIVLGSAGDHTVYQPAAGRHVRLKWFCIYSDPANAASCVATLKWLGGSNIYIVPLPAGLGAFMHSSVREGVADAILTLNLSGAQTVYVNLDVEEF